MKTFKRKKRAGSTMLNKVKWKLKRLLCHLGMNSNCSFDYVQDSKWKEEYSCFDCII